MNLDDFMIACFYLIDDLLPEVLKGEQKSQGNVMGVPLGGSYCVLLEAVQRGAHR